MAYRVGINPDTTTLPAPHRSEADEATGKTRYAWTITVTPPPVRGPCFAHRDHRVLWRMITPVVASILSS